MRMLSHFVNRNQTNWDEYLPYVTMAYNSQSHESTGYSPYELIFGRKMEVPMEADLKITDETDIYDNHIEALREKLQEAYKETAVLKARARGRNESQYDKKAKSTEFREGQFVLLHVPSIGRHRVKKLSKLWKGPYPIVRVVSPLNVVLRIRKREVVVHVNRIKPYKERPRPSTAQKEKQNENSSSDEEVDDSGLQNLNGDVKGDDETQAPVAVAGPASIGRPKRSKKEPARWGDFVRLLKSFGIVGE
ncbi:hypothetical protein J6590_108646 [Homalodisca vitripennis]|nr:hypothetical protein J6590_108646 [Homalodisca vitripennis]